jgi:plasmid stabilization system protein ParE
MLIRFHPEADKEFYEAIAWYMTQKIGLETEFMRCVDEAISRIQHNPFMFPIALRNTRKAMIKRFPYIIYYEVSNNEIMVLAIFHTKRSPNHWHKRI